MPYLYLYLFIRCISLYLIYIFIYLFAVKKISPHLFFSPMLPIHQAIVILSGTSPLARSQVRTTRPRVVRGTARRAVSCQGDPPLQKSYLIIPRLIYGPL